MTPKGDTTLRPVRREDDGPGIGELFRGAREHLGLTLEQVSRETKIPRRHLDALEHGTLAALPPFYQRAEIRTYARVLNLDPGPVLARLERGMAPSVAPNVSPKPSARHTPTLFPQPPRSDCGRVRSDGDCVLARDAAGRVARRSVGGRPGCRFGQADRVASCDACDARGRSDRSDGIRPEQATVGLDRASAAWRHRAHRCSADSRGEWRPSNHHEAG